MNFEDLHFLLLLTFICFNGSFELESSYNEEEEIIEDLLMPGVRPSQPDEYLCTAMSTPVPEIYIVDFQPKANMDTAHHLLLFGCEDINPMPGKAWNCASTMGVCKRSSKILFAWARNAPAPDIPNGVGFKIGSESNINYVVLQIHYGHIEAFQDGRLDYSGVTLVMTIQRQLYMAGIYLLSSGHISIPPRSQNIHTDISCEYKRAFSIHPFAFRTHSHDLGKVITGFRIRNGQWQILGKGNPQWPQAFYPIKQDFEIKYGDTVAARCTYSSDRDTYTRVGPTANDEMCNFYIMYYTDTDHGISYQDCSNSDSQLFERIIPGSDDPPPDPVGFDLDVVHHHHVELVNQHDEEISIPIYDHEHDLAGDNNPNDYVFNVDDDQLMTTPERNEAVSNMATLTVVQNEVNGNEGDNQFVSPASKPNELNVVKDWPAKNLVLGQISGVAVDSKGDVHLFHRADRIWDEKSFDIHNNFLGKVTIEPDTVVVIDTDTGYMKRSWGAKQFYMPHGLTIDKKDNVWLTDVALHQVLKYPPGGDSKPILTLGEALVSGSDVNHFCKPTDIAIDSDGSFFIADGYCNSRIMKFSPTGKFLMQWNGNIPFENIASFAIPHSLTLVPAQSKVCAADRENGLVSCFDSRTGVPTDVYRGFGSRIYAIEFSPHNGEIIYAVNGAFDNDKVQGFSMKVEEGLIFQKWAPDKGFNTPHDVTVSPDGIAVYVVEIGPNAVWKFQHNLSIHENDKKSAAGLLPGEHSSDDTSLNKNTNKNLKNKSLVMSRAAHAATAIVVCILIVPIVCIFIVAIFVRLRDQGHLGVIKGFPRYKSTQDRFSVGNFFNKRKGFNPVTTEGSDVEDDGSWTDGSDVEEYSRLTGMRTQNL